MGDGWETARKSDRPAVILEDADGHLMLPGSDNCVFQLGVPGRPSRIEIDTLHFKGNFPESFKVEACCGRMDPSRRSGLSQQECEALGPWFELLPRTKVPLHAAAARHHAMMWPHLAAGLAPRTLIGLPLLTGPPALSALSPRRQRQGHHPRPAHHLSGRRREPIQVRKLTRWAAGTVYCQLPPSPNLAVHMLNLPAGTATPLPAGVCARVWGRPDTDQGAQLSSRL